MTRRSHLIWISVIVLALLAGAGLGYWRAAPKTDVPPANWVFELQYPQMLDDTDHVGGSPPRTPDCY